MPFDTMSLALPKSRSAKFRGSCTCWQHPLESSEPLCRDPRDQVFLDLARAAKVNALVSGDADLLALRNPLNEPAILDPAGFQIWLRRDPRD